MADSPWGASWSTTFPREELSLGARSLRSICWTLLALVDMAYDGRRGLKLTRWRSGGSSYIEWECAVDEELSVEYSNVTAALSGIAQHAHLRS